MSICFFLFLPFGDSCILSVCFELPLKRPFSNFYSMRLSIKKKLSKGFDEIKLGKFLI